MTWNIALAKLRFSELIHALAQKPQQICNRNKVVAVVVGGADMAAFEAWRRQAARRSLADESAEARLLLAEEDGVLPVPPRTVWFISWNWPYRPRCRYALSSSPARRSRWISAPAPP